MIETDVKGCCYDFIITSNSEKEYLNFQDIIERECLVFNADVYGTIFKSKTCSQVKNDLNFFTKTPTKSIPTPKPTKSPVIEDPIAV